MNNQKIIIDLLACLQKNCGYSIEDRLQCRQMLTDYLGHISEAEIPEKPLWPSYITDDHSPIEFSVTFSKTNKPIVRVLGEPLPHNPQNIEEIKHFAQQWILKAKQRVGGWTYFDQLEKIFLPDEVNPQATFYFWFGIDLKQFKALNKVYFNPNISSSETATEKVLKTMQTFDIDSGKLQLLMKMFGLSDENFEFISIDLGDSPRLKIYIRLLQFNEKKVTDLVTVAFPEALASVKQFCNYFFDTNIGSGDLTPRSFGERNSTTGLVFALVYSITEKKIVSLKFHAPLRHYYSNDEVLGNRVSSYLLDNQYVLGNNYLVLLHQMCSYRNLKDRTGIQTLVSIAKKEEGEEITIYLAPEIYNRKQK